MEATLRPDPPRQKGNTLELVVKNREGQPVENAQVQVVASMPAMAGMPGMQSRAAVEAAGPGRYDAAFDVAMGGTWALDVAVKSAAGTGQASYRFTVGSKGLQAQGGAGGAPSGTGGAVPGTPPRELPKAVVESLRAALPPYEEARALLAQDRLEGVAPAANRLAQSLLAARTALLGPATAVNTCLDEGAAAAVRLAAASDLPAARQEFGEVSRFLIAVAAVDPRVAEGWRLFECPMTETFNLWLQKGDAIENPYLGTQMLTCGNARDLREMRGSHGTTQTAGGAPGEISHYSCSMHTTVRSDRQGTCPICSMDLVPVTKEEVQTGVIFVDPGRRQTIGVRTGPVERRRVEVEIRAVGKVAFDETRLADISVKYPGWIGRLNVNATGQVVRKGQTLFTLYSPELYSAQEEFLTALRSQKAARETAAPERADYLVEASRQRLRLWDLQSGQIDQIARSGQPLRYVPILSPVSGYVIEKEVVEGAAVEPGMKLYRIAGLDRVWIEAEVYEVELPLVRVGQEGRITLPNLPGEELVGRVSFVYPYLDDAARTGRVRIELPNRGLELKPEMYANVTLRVDRGERLVVPESAVLYAGQQRLVFVDLGEGRLKPQPVGVGLKAGDFLEVLSGLKEGDVVVTSGTFLVAAESRLKSGVEQWQ